MTTFEITNSEGTTFTVRIIRKGDPYGRNWAMTYDRDEPQVEFYDHRHFRDPGQPHSQHGQFVTRYFAKTLAESNGQGLALDCGVPSWFIDGAGWQQVIGAAKAITTGGLL